MSGWRLGAALLATIAVGVVFGAWLDGGSHLIIVYASPDRTEQLEIYSPRRWQGAWFDRGITPAFARLTSLPEDRVVAESGVFEFGGGIGDQIYWTKAGVGVGTVAFYRRATGRWKVG